MRIIINTRMVVCSFLGIVNALCVLLEREMNLKLTLLTVSVASAFSLMTQAQQSTDDFMALSQDERNQVIVFLRSL